MTHADGCKTVEPRMFLPINISFDHRALDYGDIVPFCKRLDEVFAHPEKIAEWPERPPASL